MLGNVPEKEPIGQPSNSSEQASESYHSYVPAIFAGAALSGLGTARLIINDEAHNNLKKYGAFEGILDTHRKKLRSYTSEALRQGNAGEDNSRFTQNIRQEQRRFYPDFQKRMNEIGVKTVIDEWRILHRQQRLNAIVLGFSVSGVFLGAAFELARVLTPDKHEQER